LTMVIDWQRRRAEFNHDWLKNRYINALMSFLARLRTEDSNNPQSLHEFLEKDFPVWQRSSVEAWWLVNQFEQEMSPTRLFDAPPLNECSEKVKEWLVPMVHCLWLQRYDVPRLVATARALIQGIDDGYESLSKSLSNGGEGSVFKLRAMLQEWERYADLCLELSRCIGAFPRKVEVA